jgi:hypothetical protein
MKKNKGIALIFILFFITIILNILCTTSHIHRIKTKLHDLEHKNDSLRKISLNK